MKTEKLLLDYKRYSDKDVNSISSTVVTRLTDNPNFPTTEPSLADFKVLQSAFNDALPKANSGDREQIALKNQAKDNLVAAMRQLAMNIDWQANGDKAKLLSSGFLLASQGDNSAILSPPEGFKISDGMSHGELKLQCQRSLNAVSYAFEYAYEEDFVADNWKIRTSSIRSNVIGNLQSGKKVYARVKAIGRRGQEAYSETLWRIVQ